jgi:hypothetical protein
MGLNDEREKLRTAKEYLETRSRGSLEWYAAWDHVVWVAANVTDPDLLIEARAIAEKVLVRPLPVARMDK